VTATTVIPGSAADFVDTVVAVALALRD